MEEFNKLLLLICEFFNNNNIEYFIRGGVAVILQGRFRTTEDIDIITSPSMFPINEFIEFCRENNLSVDPYDLKEAKKDGGQITIMDFAHSIRIDLKYVFSRWDREAIKNVDNISYKNSILKVCKPEYLIMNKIYKGSRIDIEDAYSVYFQNKNRLDFTIMEKFAIIFNIKEEFAKFLEKSEEISD